MNVPPPTLRWSGETDGLLVLLDQTRLPGETVEIVCRSVEDVWQAIRELKVRGAPAIGVAAAYGVCLSLSNLSQPPVSLPEKAGTGERAKRRGASSDFVEAVRQACDYLATSRPTAVNLFWALDRMRAVAERQATAAALVAEARAIHEEDRQMCDAIGRHGADLLTELPAGAGILTHCNAGALATAGDGTALSVIFELARRGRRPHVWIDETRPLLQGARLTAWELSERKIDCTLICDSMAAAVMREGRLQAVVTGADRIAANGDVANKIGTYGAATLAQAHDIPFYIAAPISTFDPDAATGAEIPIELRDPSEITHGFGPATAPAGVEAYNPAFDVTPASRIAAIITDRGVVSPVNEPNIKSALSSKVQSPS